MSAYRLTVTLDLSPTERLALEKSLHPERPTLLEREDAETWAERVLRWRLREMVAGAGLDLRPKRVVPMKQETTS